MDNIRLWPLPIQQPWDEDWWEPVEGDVTLLEDQSSYAIIFPDKEQQDMLLIRLLWHTQDGALQQYEHNEVSSLRIYMRGWFLVAGKDRK